MDYHKALIAYCHAHRTGFYGAFCEAYASFLNRPLEVREYGKMSVESQDYLKGIPAEPPHYVRFMLDKERRSVRHTQTATSGM